MEKKSQKGKNWIFPTNLLPSEYTPRKESNEFLASAAKSKISCFLN